MLAATLLACVCSFVLELALHLREGPFGGPFVLHVNHYLWHATLYDSFGNALLSLPFFGLCRALAPRSARLARACAILAAAAFAVSLALTQIDHEFQRFMGIHLTRELIRLYGHVQSTPRVIFQAIEDDRGGRNSGLYLLLVAPAYFALALYLMPRARLARVLHRTPFAHAGLRTTAALCIYFVPSYHLCAHGGKQRQAKVSPPLLVFAQGLFEASQDARRFEPIAELIPHYQSEWNAVSTERGWVFDDARYPLRRHRSAPLAPHAQPNLIVLQLETFRASEMASMNPSVGRGPTPFLDWLAHAPESAFYPRFLANGAPTINTFMSLHTGLVPHSAKVVAQNFTLSAFDAFPRFLHARGYRTAFFTASDPDWDNQRFWLQRWYDEHHYSPSHGQRDRDTFRAAAQRIRELGRAAQPFLATLVSISNHVPFRLPEARFALDPVTSARGQMHNTMRYTDDVVRELYESLHDEPWFANTVWVITGDHGYDLGERGHVLGCDNLRHETNWVPLIVSGRDDRLPRGSQSRVASHVDLAPTLVELGEYDGPEAFSGHSLLHPVVEDGAASVREGNYAYETSAHSVYFPAAGEPFVYAGTDALQQKALAHGAGAIAREFRARVDVLSIVTDWAIEHDRVTPHL